MTLAQWFKENTANKYAVRWAKNGRKYAYDRTTKNKVALAYEVEQEVTNLDGTKTAWLF